MALRFASNSVARFSSVVSVDWGNVSNKPAGLPLSVGLSEILNGTTGGLLYNNNGVLGNYPATVSGFRSLLAADRIYYVATTGSNVSNTGLSPSSAFLTIQHAVDIIQRTIDAQGFTIFILVGPGTYTTPTSISSPVPDLNVAIIIVGDTTTPSNCFIHTTGANCFSIDQGARVQISGFKLQTTTSGDCIAVNNHSICNFAQIEFAGALASQCISINNYSIVHCTGNITISGSADAFIHQPSPSIFLCEAVTITLVGIPTFAHYFIGMRGHSYALINTATFVGTALGSPFTAHFGAVLDCEGQPTNYLPGHVPGDVSGGGVYIGTTNVYSWDLRQAPVTLTGTSGSFGAFDSSIIVNASGSFTLTLPTASVRSGMWLDIKSVAAQTIASAAANVVPLAGGAAGTGLLASGAGKWASLQSDGTNWIIMSAN